MRKMNWLLGALTVALLVPATVHAQANSTQNDIKKHPGYVEFDASALFGDKTPTVQINLEGPLLQAMVGAVQGTDKDFANIVKKIALVRVYVYENLGEAGAQASDKIQALIKTLEGSGWTRAVSVNDGAEVVRIFSKLDGEMIAGLTVVVFDPSGEAVFVNIVGNMSPAEIGSLMSKLSEGEFNLPGMDGKGWDDEDDEDEDDAPKPAEETKEAPAPGAPSTP